MPSPNDEVLFDVRERLARIETKLDHSSEWREAVQSEMAAHRADIQSTLSGHDDRISVLEGRFKALAAVGAAFAFVLTFLQDWISQRLF